MPRALTALLVLMALLVAVSSARAGGGINPGNTQIGKVVGPILTGTLVFDPHEIEAVSVTPTARRATLTLTKGSSSASAVFDVLGGAYACGCDLGLTELRFGDKNLNSVVPQAVIDALLHTLGVVVPVSKQGIPATPIITDVDQPRCTGDRDSNGFAILLTQTAVCLVNGAVTFNTPASVAGIFSADLVIQFAFLEAVVP